MNVVLNILHEYKLTPLSLCNSVYKLSFVINRSVFNSHRQSEILCFIIVARCLFFYNGDLFIACNVHETSAHLSKIYRQSSIYITHIFAYFSMCVKFLFVLGSRYTSSQTWKHILGFGTHIKLAHIKEYAKRE